MGQSKRVLQRLELGGMIGPEQNRLIDRLFNDPSRKLLNFKITPGDKPCTTEELCGSINSSMDEVERRRAAGDKGDGPVKTGKPRISLRELISI
jgi:hypothetical protein